MGITCLNGKGIAKTCQKMTKTTAIKAAFLTVPGFAFPTAADFADDDYWKTEIAAGNIIPIQDVKEQENQDFEDPIIETTSGEKIDTFEGQRGSRYKCLFPLDQHKYARLLSGGNFGLIKGDRNNNLRASYLDDGVQIGGFSLSFFKVWKQLDPDAENPPYTYIDFQEEDPDEWDKSGVYLAPTWRIGRLDGVLQVDLVAGAIAAGVFVIEVNYLNNSDLNSDGTDVEKAISGLLVDNLRVFDQAGALLTPTTDYTVTPVTGILDSYTVDTTVGTPITGGTAQVIASADALYNSGVVVLA